MSAVCRRYRHALTEVVAAIVRSDEAVTDATVSARAPATATDADKDHFIELVLAEFKTLHTGNVVRFGIRPQQFSAWQEKHPHL